MVNGGNARAKKFFKERGGMLVTNEIHQKYSSDTASMYKTHLSKLAASEALKGMSPPSSPLVAAVAAPTEVVDDFFNDFDGDTAVKTKPSKISRSQSDGAVKSATPFTPTQTTTATAAAETEESPTAGDWGSDDWGAEPAAAPAAVAPKAMPQTVKVIAAKTKSSSIGKKPAKKKAVAVKVSAVKVSAPAAEEDGAKPKKNDGWGDMDSFDDAKWESIKTTSAEAEAEAARPKTLVFDSPQETGPGAVAPKKKVADACHVSDKPNPNFNLGPNLNPNTNPNTNPNPRLLVPGMTLIRNLKVPQSKL